ncbi:MAG: hypothetical protein AABW47_04590 [Nanoarchaeota archaeon]
MKRGVILTIILILLVVSSLFMINKIIEDKNKSYCLSYNFSDCPEDKCSRSSCYELKSACCPKGLFN